MRINGFARACPTCKAFGHLEGGCNRMLCNTKTCNGRFFYCYLCEKDISQEMYGHFIGCPFKNKCKTMTPEELAIADKNPSKKCFVTFIEGVRHFSVV